MQEGAHVSMVTAGGSGETSQQMAPCDRDSQLLWGQEGGDRQQGYSPKAHSAFTCSALAKCLPGSIPTVTGTEDSTAPQRCPTRQRATPTAPLTQVRASELDGARSREHVGARARGVHAAAPGCHSSSLGATPGGGSYPSHH